MTEIPSVLEVEELILRTPGNDPWMRLVAGDSDSVAVIEWYNSASVLPVAYLFGGSTNGMVFQQVNNDGSWTEVCLDEGAIKLC